MKRLFALCLLLVSPLAKAQLAAITNYCNTGAVQISTSGLKSSNYAQVIIPRCTVTVYLTGTSTLASIYSDSSGTVLTNSFTANADGSWLFFAAVNQGYDVVLSGGTCPNCYTTSKTLTGLYPAEQVINPSGISGSGTANNIPVFTAAHTLGNSSLSDNGTTVSTSEIINAASYQVSGVALAAANLSNGTTGSGSVVLATSPSISGLTVTSSFTATGLVTNADLANASTTINGTTCTLGSSCSPTVSASAITVGTTTVGGGISGYILYNNAGTLGNLATTGSGNVVLSTSPTLVTPTLGAASATSINSLPLGQNSTYSISIGTSAQPLTNSGTQNVGIGYAALGANTAASYDVGIGTNALQVATGGYNTALGTGALQNITSGTQNIGIGYAATGNGATDTNETIIGYNLAGNGSNTVTIGNSSVTKTYLRGTIYVNGTALAASNLSNGTTGSGNVVLATSPSISGLTVTSSFTATGLVTNADLANASTTVNGETCTLGSSCAVTLADLKAMGPIINPINYGAKCDGTTDDSTALQAAINAAETQSASNPGTLFIPPGSSCSHATTLTVSGYLTIIGVEPKAYSSYAGSGLIYTGTSDGIVVGTSGNYSYFFSFKNLNYTATAAAQTLIRLYGINGPSKIDNNNFNGSWLASSAIIYDLPGAGLQTILSNNFIQAFVSNEVIVHAYGNIDVQNNQFFATYAAGLYLDNTCGTAEGNYFELMAYGIEIANDSENQFCYDIHDNNFRNPYIPPISSPVLTSTNRCILIKSTANSLPMYGQGSIKHNFCNLSTSTETQGTALYGIDYETSSNTFYVNQSWEIEDNAIAGITTSGIYGDSASVNIFYKDNQATTFWSSGSVAPVSLPQVSGTATYTSSIVVNQVGLTNQPSGIYAIGLGSSYIEWKHVYDYTVAGAKTGTMKINLPSGKRWSNSINIYKIHGFNFSTNSSWEVLIGGLNESSLLEWENSSATIIGTAPFTSVRLGDDGTYNCILLGTTSTSTWYDPSISIDVFSKDTSGWSSGWGLTFVTSESGITVTGSPTVNANTLAQNLVGSTLGSIPYGSGTNTTGQLAGNTAATDTVLTSTGTGSAAQAPTLKNNPALSAANMTNFPSTLLNTSGGQTISAANTVSGLPSGCQQYPCTVASLINQSFSNTSGTNSGSYATLYAVPSTGAGVYQECYWFTLAVAGTAGTFQGWASFTAQGNAFATTLTPTVSTTTQWNHSTINQACGTFYADASTNINYLILGSSVTGSPTVDWSVTLQRLE